ncbi:MAG TPA: heavy metal sensor histidine kinase [Blastocatellia bacterium]|nr:heavy metal sensor histidine kinase [Blastocatellia bacterium]
MRVKLTLYYLALLTAVLVFFGVAIYTYLARSLVTIIDDSLAATAQSIERRMHAEEVSEEQPLPEQSEQMLVAPQIVQIISEDGTITDEPISDKKMRSLPVEIAVLRDIKDDQVHFATVKLPSGEQVRIALRRTRDHENQTFFIRVGQSLSPLQKARRQMLTLLAIAGPVALLLGSYGGLLLANQALYPVDRLTRAAEEIEAGDLSKRVQVPPQMDELGRLAVTFNRMIARLQAAFERQRQFTADASHELRTPLAVMRGDIEIALRRERTPEEYRSVLTSNLEEIIRLSRLVEDMLMLARADAAQTALQREPMNLDELCAQVVDYITPLAEEKEQQLIYEPPATRPLQINADAQRIKQLLLNLLDNALKYTPTHGTITLTLSAEEHEAVLRITDTGRGIPEEDLPHIFDRFFRHSRSTSDKTVQGFGLGLSIVRWIVHSHGGKIAAESTLGKGTKFTVRLPLR